MLLVCDIYNQSLINGVIYIPYLLKSSIVSPILNVSPPGFIEKDLMPISLTCTIAKAMEGFTCSRLLPRLDSEIDSSQYACKGHPTTDAFYICLR